MYISIDVGGTNIRIALVDLSGKESIVRLESHRVPQDYSTGIEELSGHIAALSEGQDIQGIGACFPGIIDENDMVTTANNLPDWAMKPIKETLQERFNVPVKLVHDVQGAAIGEALFGAAIGRDRFVYFIWGTGLGAGDIKKIDDNRGDMGQTEFIDFLIDSQLSKGASEPQYATREEVYSIEHDMKKLLKSFLDFFVNYGLELGKQSPETELVELTSKLQGLQKDLDSDSEKGKATIKWK